jgi:hypothetical protein
MKYFIGLFIGLIVLMLLFLAVIKLYDSDVDTFQVKEKQVEEKPIEKKKIVPPHKVVKKVLPKPLPKKEKKSVSIPKNVMDYLQDEVVELKQGMNLKQVDKIWGKPDKVEREYKDGKTEITWTYGNYWKRQSKLKGLYYYKFVIFKDGKLHWYRKDIQIDIKTHDRNNAVLSHLDEGPTPKKNMSKKELYKLWGLPYKMEIVCFNNIDVGERWLYKIGDDLSHYCVIRNNKLISWDDY